jgi:hypothetical protein
MMRLKPASLAILGTASIVVSVLASPAVAKGAKAETFAKEQPHVQRPATHPNRNANAALRGKGMHRTPPANANATTPSRTFDSYTNY